MNLNLESITTNLISQISFVIVLIMVVRALIAYTKEDWGAFISGLVLGILCLIVAFFGPQIESLAREFGRAIFG
ncbi:hypothetical protein J26TS2_44890 [Shouchella clausii]|nr:hypothetical protein J26TS2_44890 [Shouchella clausii]